MEVFGDEIDVVVEPELAHYPEDVLRCGGLLMLALTPLVGLSGDEADVLGDALLDHLLVIVGDLGVGRDDLSHDPDDVRDGHEQILLPHGTVIRAFVRSRVAPDMVMLI